MFGAPSWRWKARAFNRITLLSMGVCIAGWIVSIFLTAHIRYDSHWVSRWRVALDSGAVLISRNADDWRIIQSHMAGSSSRPAWVWSFAPSPDVPASLSTQRRELTMDCAWHPPLAMHWWPRSPGNTFAGVGGVGGAGWVWLVPLWIPAAGLLGVAAWLIRRDRRRGSECGKCGYSREGLGAEAVCPECGACPLRTSR